MTYTTAGSHSRHVNVRIHFDAPARPLDIEGLVEELTVATAQTRWNLRAANFVHNIDLLRAGLYAQATSTPLASALETLRLPNTEARERADAMLTSTLSMARWHKDTPEPNPQPISKPSMFPGVRLPVDIGKERHGDVLVNIHTGLTIVADADGADRYHWEHLWRETVNPVKGKLWHWAKVDPDDIAAAPVDEWWWTQNYEHGTSNYDRGAEKRYLRENLSVPELPVDLTALLSNL